MPFNPETYRLQNHPEIAEILEAAVELPVFVSCADEKEARSLYFKCGQYRKAYEVQAQTWTATTPGEHMRYSWLRFQPEERQGQWGLHVFEQQPSEMQARLLNPDTLEPLTPHVPQGQTEDDLILASLEADDEGH